MDPYYNTKAAGEVNQVLHSDTILQPDPNVAESLEAIAKARANNANAGTQLSEFTKAGVWYSPDQL